MATGSAPSKFDTFLNEKYIPLEKKVKIIILFFAILLPIALFFFLLYRPGADKIQTLNKQKASMKTELMKAQKASRDLPKYKASMEETQKRFEATAVLLPKKKEIPNLLRNISDLGKGAGLDFLSFKPAQETPKDFYSEIPIDIAIRGPYHNMGFFLDQVSKLDRIVTVDNIKMSDPQKEGGEMLLDSNCRLMTYRFTNVKIQNQAEKKKK